MLFFLLRVTWVSFAHATHTDVLQAILAALLSLRKTIVSRLKLINEPCPGALLLGLAKYLYNKFMLPTLLEAMPKISGSKNNNRKLIQFNILPGDEFWLFYWRKLLVQTIKWFILLSRATKLMAYIELYGIVWRREGPATAHSLFPSIWPLRFKVAEHSSRAHFCWCDSARAQGLQKQKCRQ